MFKKYTLNHMMNRKKHSVTTFHTVLQVHVPDKPMQTMQRIQGMHTAKEAKNVFFFIVNSLFSSAFLFLSGLPDIAFAPRTKGVKILKTTPQ